MLIGYTTGVYDLFHVGHLNLLKNAKGLCDKLIVGVTVDELVAYKGKQAMIPFEDRIEIVRSCKYVDAAIPQYDMDKLTACKKLGADILFVGDDWYATEKWKQYERILKKKEYGSFISHIRGAYHRQGLPKHCSGHGAGRRNRHSLRSTGKDCLYGKMKNNKSFALHLFSIYCTIFLQSEMKGCG